MTKTLIASFTSLTASGLLLLALACGGGGSSSAGAKVTTPPSAAPVISGFSPTSGAVGQSVIITGTQFSGATSVQFYGTAATTYHVDSATQITAAVPIGASSGTLSVTTAQGTATSSAGFTVSKPPAPTLTSFTPASGIEGTIVTLTGTNFTSATAVTFNGANAATFTVDSATQIKATVPTGASTGVMAVTTAGGTATSTDPFTVTGAATLDLALKSWYITQGTQDYSGTVPLVANRDGIFRAFVTANEANTATPQVRVTISSGSSITWQTTLDAPGASVPTAVNEGDMSQSWNILVPGSKLAAGETIKVEVDPLGAFPEISTSNNSETATLNVQTVKVFNVTLVAITSNGLTGNVDTGRTLESWVDRLQRMYPIQNMPGGIDVQVRSTALETTADLSTGATSAGGSGTGWSTCLNDLNTARLADHGGSTRYYFGAVNVNYGGGIAGLGYVGYPAAIGWDKTGRSDGGNYPEVFAHEVGHNFGRDHAPCGVTDADTAWPKDAAHANASIGVYGMDVSTMTLKVPSTTTNDKNYRDIMSYCDPPWVSDYTYKGILNFRSTSSLGMVVQANEVAPAAEPTKEECLLVSGHIEKGNVVLESVFQVLTVPQPPEAGDYTLELLDAGGSALVRVPFAPVQVADLQEGDAQHFTFTLPLETRVESALSSLRILERGEVRHFRKALPAAAVSAVREPVVTAMKAGLAHLSWDSGVHSKVMVRDVRTGYVIAFGKEGSLDLHTDAGELEITFSDGVRSQRRVLKVQE